MSGEKENAARAAVGLVKDGMAVGLGSGSTSAIFIKLLGEKAKVEKLSLRCVPTSEDSRMLAIENGLHVVGIDEVDRIDLAVDGADAVDGKMNLVKGGGGCHAREKVVAYAAKKFVCIVDEGKVRKSLAGVPVPVEVLPFAASLVKREIEGSLGAKVEVRKGAGKMGPLLTDNGNYILDAVFKEIAKPEAVETGLQLIPGAVANGIFAVRKPDVLIVGRKAGAEIVGG